MTVSRVSCEHTLLYTYTHELFAGFNIKSAFVPLVHLSVRERERVRVCARAPSLAGTGMYEPECVCVWQRSGCRRFQKRQQTETVTVRHKNRY